MIFTNDIYLYGTLGSDVIGGILLPDIQLPVLGK